MTLQDALDFGKKILKDHHIPDWDVDAWLLLQHIFKIDKATYWLSCNDMVRTEQWEQYYLVLEQRSTHMPLQYIIGRQEFMGIDFAVTPDVLIPRMDTECLVLESEKYLRPHMRILDMCTGSGCIVISLKKRNPEIEAVGSDISDKALKIACKNASANNTEVTFVQSDLFEKVEGIYDLIISNPPYIPSEQVNELMEEVRDYEPRIALDGTSDGLRYYREISREGYRYLKPGGLLFYEIGCEQAQEVSVIMESAGFKDIKIIQDLAGLNRVVYGGKEDV